MSQQVKEVIEKITNFSEVFPREELQFLIEHKEEVTPYLLESISNHKEVLKRMLEDEDYFLPMYSFYLLAQFREEKAYPLIYNIFSLDSEEVDEAFGEFAAGELGQILASVCGGDTSLINKLIEDTNVNEYVRSAAINSWLCLHLANLKTRDEVISYYKTIFELPCEEGDFFRASLITSCMDLRATELLPDIEKSFAENKVELGITGDLKIFKKLWETVEKEKGSFFEESEKHYHLINDTISEMEWWACFNESKAVSIPSLEDDIDLRKMAEIFGNRIEDKEDNLWWDSSRSATFVRETPKVGKNEPCPCGSGRKYKKCCLN